MIVDRETVWRLDQTVPITRQIYAHLRDAIIRCELSPGNRISESEIARSCQVSRQPVREAFIRLAGEDLLEIRPQRGTVISKIDYHAVLDARFFREAIEADIVAILASRPDPALIDKLRHQLEAQKAAEDAPRFIRLDERFHHTLADAAGKQGAWKLIDGLKSQMDRVRFLSLDRFRVGRLIDQHATIVESIAAGDSSRANVAIRTHLRAILADLPEIIAANPEFFSRPAGELPDPVNAPIQLGGQCL